MECLLGDQGWEGAKNNSDMAPSLVDGWAGCPSPREGVFPRNLRREAGASQAKTWGRVFQVEGAKHAKTLRDEWTWCWEIPGVSPAKVWG